jgi:hypothetical protein
MHDKIRVRQGASPTVLSHLEIGGDKRISRHLSPLSHPGLFEKASFRLRD